MMRDSSITMVHGSGGASTDELIRDVFAGRLSDEILNRMEDAAVVSLPDEGSKTIAITTDSFVVSPVEFAGGDIGRLAVCGTVNDLLMRGAVPMYMTAGWILEVGAEVGLLKRLVDSMADTAEEAGIRIVAGDTKVVEGQGGILVNTTGVGFVPDSVDISAKNAMSGDVIILSGNVGDHHAAILKERMEIQSDIISDVAPLTKMCTAIRDKRIHTMRDVTRGGLATVLKELATASGKTFTIREDAIQVDPKVRSFCGLLGLDPLYMGNEGKMVVIADPADAKEILEKIRSSKYGENAAIIGEVTDEKPGVLYEKTKIGGIRELNVLQGEGLPRIC